MVIFVLRHSIIYADVDICCVLYFLPSFIGQALLDNKQQDENIAKTQPQG
jgi:hypothetical protein